jgi:hypothetical protein
MHFFSFVVAALLLEGCALRTDTFYYRWTTKYYDRNHDGIVDFELHHMRGGADTDWAYIDTQFRGRYNTRIHWGEAVQTQHVDIPVPRRVAITPGQPPVSISK